MPTHLGINIDDFCFSILMVVGAGRGPLVRASFAASQDCGRAVKVYAIEKNPNAVVTYVHIHQSFKTTGKDIQYRLMLV